MKLTGGDWSRGDIIAAAGLVVAIVGVLLSLPTIRRWDRGRLAGVVHEFEDDRKLVANMEVMLKVVTARPTTSDGNGNYSFVLSPDDLNQTAEVWASGNDQYAPSDPVKRLLKDENGPLDLLVKARSTAPELPHDPAPQNIIPAANPTSSRPSHFYFMYPFQPSPGRRDWTRIDEQRWIELYADGSITPFTSNGGASVDGCEGTTVANDHTPSFEVFIPARGCSLMWTRFRSGNGNWQFLGQMQDVSY